MRLMYQSCTSSGAFPDLLPAASILLDFGDHLHMATVADTSESLPSKAVCSQRLQVVKLAELARGISHAQQGQVVSPDTVTVVRDLNEFESALFDVDLDRG